MNTRNTIITALLISLSPIFSSCTEETDEDQEMYIDLTGQGGSQTSTSTGSDVSSPSLEQLVNDNVKCSARFSDYYWEVTIESTLTRATGASVDFKIGHGTSYDSNCTIVNNEKNAEKSITTSGTTTRYTIREPFYYYFIYSGNSNVVSDCAFYMNSYNALKKKGTLSSSEKDLMSDIQSVFNSNLSKAYSYAIYVFAYVDGKSVRVGRYTK